MDAKTLAQILSLQFSYTSGTLDMNLAGVSDEDALRTAGDTGNCAGWIMGHLVHSRIGTLGLVGVEPPVDAATYERFCRSSASLARDEDVPTFTRMREDFKSTQEPLFAGLKALTDEAVAAPAPFSPAKREDETIGTLLVGIVFHESYHAGQMGMLRRHLGLEGAIR